MRHPGVVHPPTQKHEEKMKKIATGATLIAAVGFSALSVAPAAAVTLPFPNCDTAEAAGVYNIPASSAAYGTHLDRDGDGFGCDATTNPYNQEIVDQIVAGNTGVSDTVPPVVDSPQMEQMPVGGAETGVAQESTHNTSALALGGGMALMAAAGGTYVVRRRNAQA